MRKEIARAVQSVENPKQKVGVAVARPVNYLPSNAHAVSGVKGLLVIVVRSVKP